MAAPQAGGELTGVGEADDDLLGILDHMVVGHHVAFGRDDESRACPAADGHQRFTA